MPRKQAKRKLMEFTELEWEMLHYLAGHGPSQNVVRAALVTYAKHEPKFELEAFAKHVTKTVMPAADEREREALKAQLAALRRQLAGDVTPSIDEAVDSSSVFGR